jgi:hypothetical protein
MVDQNRDKYLTEAMGLYHKSEKRENDVYYCVCGKVWGSDCAAKSINCIPSFYAWTGFGKLWEWAQEQEWWKDFGPFGHFEIDFGKREYKVMLDFTLINPDRFANAVYEFLKARES